MILTFVAPSSTLPVGGVKMIFAFADAMAARGHTVHLYHIERGGIAVGSVSDIAWFPFTSDVHHHFPDGGRSGLSALDRLVAADIFFGYVPSAEMPDHIGLPVVLIQGWQMLHATFERNAFEAPCPKVCVARWLTDVGRDLGVPAHQLVHVPLGLDHDVYRLTRPLHARPDRVSFLYSRHPRKGPDLALDVINELDRLRPDLQVAAFGTEPLPEGWPHFIEYRTDPAPEVLVEEIYNTSTVFLCTSEVEGFGFPAIESMACGAALVTTDNGGSRDYATHGATALVSAPGDRKAMVDHVCQLLDNPARREVLARAGGERAREFRWDRSAEILEEFLAAYLRDPHRYSGTDADRARYRARPERHFP